MAMPTSGQSRNSSSISTSSKDLQGRVLEGVLLHVEVDERAVLPGGAEDGPQTRANRRLVPSGSIGSNWLYRADSLTETLTRGKGPCSSRSISGFSVQAFTERDSPVINS